jgi:hypothetical protein
MLINIRQQKLEIEFYGAASRFFHDFEKKGKENAANKSIIE